jgi:hypothetical protein
MVAENGTLDALIEQLGAGCMYAFHDVFPSQAHLDDFTAGTGGVSKKHLEVKLSTGTMAGSSALVNYENPIFNPFYSTTLIKARFSIKTGLEAFIGFKSSLLEPSFTMTESHAGIYVKDGIAYFSTGFTTGLTSGYQNTPIPGLDVTRWITFKLDKLACSWYSLPVLTPYFDGFATPVWSRSLERKWSQLYHNNTSPPVNQAHYLVFWIKNTLAADRSLEVQHVTHKEIYPD